MRALDFFLTSSMNGRPSEASCVALSLVSFLANRVEIDFAAASMFSPLILSLEILRNSFSDGVRLLIDSLSAALRERTFLNAEVSTCVPVNLPIVRMNHLSIVTDEKSP